MAARRSARRSSSRQSNLSNNNIVVLALAAIMVSSFGTYMLLDTGILQVTGAAGSSTAFGNVTLTVSEVVACDMTPTNVTAAFGSVAAGATVKTEDGDANGGTIIINNTGNTLINISVNSTNISTVGGGFFDSGATQADYYQIGVGNQCGNGNLTTGGIGTSIYSYANAQTGHRRLVADLNYSAGNDTCAVEFNITVPVDEPIGLKRDTINFNCTQV